MERSMRIGIYSTMERLMQIGNANYLHGPFHGTCQNNLLIVQPIFKLQVPIYF